MPKEEQATNFAPAERASTQDLLRQSGLFTDKKITRLLDFVPDIIIILNSDRQAVFGNKALLDMLRVGDYTDIIGLRPGELVKCINSDTTPGGCGTSNFCSYCGAVKAILKSIDDVVPAQDECHLLTRREECEEALDLHVWTTPFEFEDEHFVFFAMTDIADEKRKQFLERIFMHDIMNTAVALRGFSELISAGIVEGEQREDMMQRISFLSNRIIDEINAQKQLMAAEKDELVLEKKQFETFSFLKGLFGTYNRPDMLNHRILMIAESAESIIMTSDERLMSRVIGNMIKNALEASVPGETVTFGSYLKDGMVRFFVNNPTYMPENIRAHVFNRSFSTKGAGRGLGTYSMKYLTEKYLNGSISFETSEENGTTFTVVYPLEC
jgi:signal transduction histidine kinase